MTPEDRATQEATGQVNPSEAHWIAGMARTKREGWHEVVVRSAEDADDYRAQGWTVSGPFVRAGLLAEGESREP